MDNLKDALDGLFAYDTGSTDSGTHDPALKAEARTAVAALSDRDLSVLIRDMWLNDDALDQGYTIEDALEFVDWLSREMGIDLR